VQLEDHLLQYINTSGQHYEEVKRGTKIVYDPNDLTREGNCYNIDFIPSGNSDEELRASRLFFSNLLSTELRLRKLPVYGSLQDRRLHLKALEQKLDMISQAISRGEEGKEAALMLISQAIPCIMHLENRVGEKLITVLLARAAEKYQETAHV